MADIDMDDSLVASVLDDGESSDNFSPVLAVVSPSNRTHIPPPTYKTRLLTSSQKTKAKAAPKAAVKKTAALKEKAGPKPRKPKEITAKPKVTAKATTSKKRAKLDTEDEESEPEIASLHDDTLLNATPPSAKKQKKEPVKKKAGKPLQVRENDAGGFDGTDEPKPKKGSATEQYQKLTQLEHIIKRPDTYIGSVERSEKQMWVYNTELDSMEMREVSFVPGLYKIFDEILVNAADNKQRDKNMDTIKVTVDREKGEISVWNNGRGIPIEIHEVSITMIGGVFWLILSTERANLHPRNDIWPPPDWIKLR